MPSQVLLAPVPAIHLQDVLSICSREGAVAFGSDAWETLNGIKANMPVYIYASQTGSNASSLHFRPGKVQLRGLFVCWEKAHAGKCLQPARRPTTALETDAEFGLFWYVSDLEKLTSDMYLEQFSYKKVKGQEAPFGPVLATMKEGYK